MSSKNRKIPKYLREELYEVEEKEEKKEIKLKIKAKSENQQDYLRAICENDLVIAKGPSGTGKTMLAVYIACSYLLEGKIKKILLTRPIVGCGSGIGYLPGDLNTKISNYMIPLYDYVELFLGKDLTEELVDDGTIELFPVELIRGRTFVDTFMLLDEAQNCDYKQLKNYMTRIGNGSKMVICGDVEQSDLIKEDDLDSIIDKTKEIEEVGRIELTSDDIFRSKLVKKLIIVL